MRASTIVDRQQEEDGLSSGQFLRLCHAPYLFVACGIQNQSMNQSKELTVCGGNPDVTHYQVESTDDRV